MSLILPAHYNAARHQLDNAGGGAGPWADPFDDPTGTIVATRWENGSTSGSGKTNCNLWSNKLGFSGPGDGVEWRKSSGSGRADVELLNYENYGTDSVIFRFRAKAETYTTEKTWVFIDTLFMDPAFTLSVDITDDGTAAASRIGAYSGPWSDVWCDEHPSYPGWMFFKARLDLTAASDPNGGLVFNLTDADGGDGLYPLDDFWLIRLQDFTLEIA